MRTLKNAFAADRIAHAFIMTGVRGVGKTTTARIIAKGLNCIGPDGSGGPTTEPCGRLRRLPGDRRGPSCRRAGNGRGQPHRGERYPRDHRLGALPGDLGALQDLYHRRGSHALDQRLQRAAQDAGGAARSCEVHLRHHRDPQGAGDGAVALPALRPAPDRTRGDDRPSAAHRRAGRRRDRGRRAGPDHAGRRGLGARRDEPDGSGDRPRRGRDHGRPGAGDAGAGRPRPRARPVRHDPARRRGGGAGRAFGAICRRGRSDGGAARPGRDHPLGQRDQDHPRGGRGPDRRARGTGAGAGDGGPAADAGADPDVADAAQGARRGGASTRTR